MDADSLVGMAVVGVDDARKVGTVSDLLFAAQPFAVAALKVGGSDGSLVIPFGDIATVGTDAVIVRDTAVGQAFDSGGVGYDLDRTKAHALKVVDEAGSFIGTIKSIEIDAATGHVVRLTAARGGVLGVGGSTRTLAADAIRTVGADLLTVKEAAAP